MSANSAVSMALAKCGKRQRDLADPWGVSKSAISNKFYRDSWSASDLVKVAEILGCKLMFVFPDGQQIYINDDRSADPSD